MPSICTQDVIGRNAHNYIMFNGRYAQNLKQFVDQQQHIITIRAPVGANKASGGVGQSEPEPSDISACLLQMATSTLTTIRILSNNRHETNLKYSSPLLAPTGALIVTVIHYIQIRRRVFEISSISANIFSVSF